MTEKTHENGPQWQASDHSLDGDGSSGRTRLKKTLINIGIRTDPPRNSALQTSAWPMGGRRGCNVPAEPVRMWYVPFPSHLCMGDSWGHHKSLWTTGHSRHSQCYLGSRDEVNVQVDPYFETTGFFFPLKYPIISITYINLGLFHHKNLNFSYLLLQPATLFYWTFLGVRILETLWAWINHSTAEA